MQNASETELCVLNAKSSGVSNKMFQFHSHSLCDCHLSKLSPAGSICFITMKKSEWTFMFLTELWVPVHETFKFIMYTYLTSLSFANTTRTQQKNNNKKKKNNYLPDKPSAANCVTQAVQLH